MASLIIIFMTLCVGEKVSHSSTCLLVSLNCHQDTVLWHLREKSQLRHFLDYIGLLVYFSGGLLACFLAIWKDIAYFGWYCLYAGSPEPYTKVSRV